MGAVLAKATNDLPVAIVQMGATLPTQNPPIRVAEEYAMKKSVMMVFAGMRS